MNDTDRIDLSKLPDFALLSTKHILALIPVSGMSLFRWIRLGVFPRPIKVQRLRYWRASVVRDWLESRQAEAARAA